MAYIGNIPAVQYASFSKQTLTADSSTTSFTLDNAVANENEIEVFVNNVRQEPGSGRAYTASGTTLTMSAAPTTGDSFYVIFQGKATQTVTAPAGSVTTAQLADSSVSLAKLTATGTKDSTTFLRGDNTFAVAGGTNTPAFEAYRTSNQSISNATWTKVQNDIELFDTDNCYDNSTNYRFTPTTAGKYYIFGQIFIPAQSIYIGIAKNGSRITTSRQYASDSDNALMIGQIFDANGSSDYFELECFHQDGASANTEGSERRTHFGAYKILT
jgi:hypothetical protein